MRQPAELANKVMEIAGPTPPRIAGVSAPLSKEVETLCEEVARLKKAHPEALTYLLKHSLILSRT